MTRKRTQDLTSQTCSILPTLQSEHVAGPQCIPADQYPIPESCYLLTCQTRPGPEPQDLEANFRPSKLDLPRP